VRKVWDLPLARALHVLAVVRWIGGVALVTIVLLPAIDREVEPGRRVAFFESVEVRFAAQSRLTTLLAGASGFYLAWRPDLRDGRASGGCTPWWRFG
jgi:uncharacterized membrane protein